MARNSSDFWATDGKSKLKDENYVGLLTKAEIMELAPTLINPTPSEGSKQYQVASVDLTAGAILCRDRQVIDPDLLSEAHVGAPGRRGFIKLLTNVWRQSIGDDRVDLGPGEVATIITREELRMPLDLAGNSLPIIELARDGLLGLTYGHIDPGYVGHLAVRVLNVSSNKFPIPLGEPIMTVTFQKLAQAAQNYHTNESTDFKSMLHRAQKSVLTTVPVGILGLTAEDIPEQIKEEIQMQVRRSLAWAFAGIGLAFTVGGAVIGAIAWFLTHFQFHP